MFTGKVLESLNRQINAELYSSYLYLSMSAYFDSQNLAGMANWMRIQAQEELTHSMKFFDFVNERDGRVLVYQIDSPKTDWASPLEVFEDTLEHERKVTGLINDLVDLSIGEHDHATNAFLQWFVSEQVEEEAAAIAILEKFKLVGEDPVALYMLDRELGQRTLVMPNAAKE